MAIENYLIPGKLFVERAQTEIAELKNTVFTSSDIEGVEEDAQPTPSLHAVFDSDNPKDSIANRGAEQVISQSWYLVPATKDVRDLRRAKDGRSDTGRLIPKILRAFKNWTPPQQGDMVFQPAVRIWTLDKINSANHISHIEQFVRRPGIMRPCDTKTS